MPSAENCMHWLEAECPTDLVAKVLAFAGPQKTAAISQTNRFWRDIMNEESTWKSLCEELYKVSCRSNLRDWVGDV